MIPRSKGQNILRAGRTPSQLLFGISMAEDYRLYNKESKYIYGKNEYDFVRGTDESF